MKYFEKNANDIIAGSDNILYFMCQELLDDKKTI